MIRSKKTLNRSRIASIARNQPNLARAALLDALKPNRPSARVAAMAAMLVASGCASTQVSYSGMDAPGLRTADEALRVGSTQLALQVSESVLRTAPSNGNALEIKADALAQLGKTDEAAAIFQTLLSQNPDNIRANIGMGRIKLLTDASVAEPLFQRVLRADPTNLTALNNLGIARDLLGRHDEAQATYRKALDLSPNMESAVVNLSLSLAMSGRGAEAMQLLGPKARAPEASSKIKQDYASVLSMSGHKAEAERFLAQNMSADGIRQVLDSVSSSHAQAIADFAPPTAETRQMASAAPAPTWTPPAPTAMPAAPASVAAVSPAPVSASIPVVAPPAAQPMMAHAAPMPSVSAPGGAASAQPTSLADIVSSETVDNDPGPAVIVPAVIAMPAPVAPIAGPAPIPTVHSAQVPNLSSQGAFPTMTQPSGALLGAIMTPPDTGTAAVTSVPLPTPSYVTAMPAPLPSAPMTAAVVSPAARPAPVATPVAAMAPVAPVAKPVTQAVAAVAPVQAPAPKPVHTISASAAEPAAAPAQAPVQAKADLGPKTTLALVTGDARHMPATAAVTTTTTPSGTAVQFAAAASEDAAHALWSSLVKKFPAELGHREAVVIRVEAGHNVFFRLRTVGFDNAADARGLCAHMRAAGQACFVPGA